MTIIFFWLPHRKSKDLKKSENNNDVATRQEQPKKSETSKPKDNIECKKKMTLEDGKTYF
ncbi:MAG: hypothetical protein Q8894_01620 [Sweet potato little leaf phytoplasma]|nr:hypothetical protein [Candidatus Phytoplasma australasiaticum]MDV3204478.1 hypothetical protein [Sweet potato little leaf phytoplasma]MDV3153807.1 hypothetical protein [Candidatus Phytoplasma australasiaticum]MDV3167648.1 hypothetical protein [Candidatus Phytoplasma australasiaticum]MDV3183291.1 hypothetical protein [Candidatus Phytoplasma australasiaticum]